eukprot:jgi/Picsp_1/6579/NSC_03922-R1_mixed-lineage leukemia mll
MQERSESGRNQAPVSVLGGNRIGTPGTTGVGSLEPTYGNNNRNIGGFTMSGGGQDVPKGFQTSSFRRDVAKPTVSYGPFYNWSMDGLNSGGYDRNFWEPVNRYGGDALGSHGGPPSFLGRIGSVPSRLGPLGTQSLARFSKPQGLGSGKKINQNFRQGNRRDSTPVLSGKALTNAAPVLVVKLWYERSLASYEKAKQIFDHVSKRCEGLDVSISDQEKFVNIGKEVTVRQLDFNAASQAMRLSDLEERKWSTSPQCQGFRTHARDIPKYIEINSLDAMSIMYSIDDQGIHRSAIDIASDLEELRKKADDTKQLALSTAREYDIPLNDHGDSFLEYADQIYILDTDDCPSGQHRHEVSMQNDVINRKTEQPATSLMMFKNVENHNDSPGDGQPPASRKKSYTRHLGATNPGIHREQPQHSMNTFQASLQHIFGANSEGLSPKFDTSLVGGQISMPFPQLEDPFGDALDELTSGLAQKDTGKLLPNELEERRDALNLCKKDSHCRLKEAHEGNCMLLDDPILCFAEMERDQAKLPPSTMGDMSKAIIASLKDQDSQAPLCYCGVKCEKKSSGTLGPYWGCKKSNCNAQMPIIARKDGPNSDRSLEEGNARKVGRARKLPDRFNEFEIAQNVLNPMDTLVDNAYVTSSSGKPEFVENESPAGRATDGYMSSPSLYAMASQRYIKGKRIPGDGYKAPYSHESSGRRDSGTLYCGNDPAFLCKKSHLCSRPKGHTGKCNRKRVPVQERVPGSSTDVEKRDEAERNSAHAGTSNGVRVQGNYQWGEDEILLSHGKSPASGILQLYENIENNSAGKKVNDDSNSSQATEVERAIHREHGPQKPGELRHVRAISAVNSKSHIHPPEKNDKALGLKVTGTKRVVDEISSWTDQNSADLAEIESFENGHMKKRSKYKITADEDPTTIPEEERCRKTPTCYKRRGHRGRCPMKPYSRKRRSLHSTKKNERVRGTALPIPVLKADNREEALTKPAEGAEESNGSPDAVHCLFPEEGKPANNSNSSEERTDTEVTEAKPEIKVDMKRPSSNQRDSGLEDNNNNNDKLDPQEKVQLDKDNKMEDKAPVVEEREPGTEGTALTAEGKVPLVDENAPFTEEKTPLVEEKEPLADEMAPAAEEEAPVVKEKEQPVEEKMTLVEEESSKDEAIQEYLRECDQGPPLDIPLSKAEGASWKDLHGTKSPKLKGKQQSTRIVQARNTMVSPDNNPLLKQIRSEFNNLSSDYVVTFYGSSRTCPADAWQEHKREYTKQFDTLAASPPIDFDCGSKSKLAGAKTIIGIDVWESIFDKLDEVACKEGVSAIHGNGLFARRKIDCGSFVTILAGEYLDSRHVEERKLTYNKRVNNKEWPIKNGIGTSKGPISHVDAFLYHLSTDWYLDATQAGSMARFINHSCSPNCEFKFAEDTHGAKFVLIYASKMIKAGEELTCDYSGLCSGFVCKCGFERCKGKI